MSEEQDLAMARLEQSTQRYERAAMDIVEDVREAFPVGMVVRAELGGHEVDLEVIGYSGAWWSSPDEIIGRNIRTGKKRLFRPGHVISMAKNPNWCHSCSPDNCKGDCNQ